MRQYLNLLSKCLEGELKKDRTGTGTYSIFGTQMKFDQREGFPLVTTKKVYWKGIVHELLWFISGNTNIQYLKDNGVYIWNEWANEFGNLGPVYGEQWRHWNGIFESIDQLQNAIDLIKHDPHSRRIIVSSWNVADLPSMALAPCHLLFQFNVSGDLKYLDLQLYQRSADMFLGVPFNIASYSLLLHMVAQVTNKIPRIFTWNGGDTHIYTNHVNQVNEQLTRKPLNLPTLKLNREIMHIDDFKYEDIELLNYESYPSIKAPIAV